ncbi:hypothetical protein HanRHA438_Chr12g0555001 [Helianthus annuus]|nr:hypothetical protein HanRHA438_Chr12g0555001 [Helianthus annuus]
MFCLHIKNNQTIFFFFFDFTPLIYAYMCKRTGTIVTFILIYNFLISKKINDIVLDFFCVFSQQSILIKLTNCLFF